MFSPRVDDGGAFLVRVSTRNRRRPGRFLHWQTIRSGSRELSHSERRVGPGAGAECILGLLFTEPWIRGRHEILPFDSYSLRFREHRLCAGYRLQVGGRRRTEEDAPAARFRSEVDDCMRRSTRFSARNSRSSTCISTSTMRWASRSTCLPPNWSRAWTSSTSRRIIILTGMWGDKLQHVLDEMVKPYPGRFLVFTQIDWSKIDDPNFSQEMVQQLDDAVRRGARGLKVLKDLGLGVRDKSRQIDHRRRSATGSSVGRMRPARDSGLHSRHRS